MNEFDTDPPTDAELPRSTAELAERGKDASDQPEQTQQGKLGALFDGDDAERFRERWQDIQSHFVDEPRRAVEEGDALVATLMQRLAEQFSEERSNLEQQWDREGDDVSTEDLRVALQRYRSFFDRLLSA
jgi:hypothetical protein